MLIDQIAYKLKMTVFPKVTEQTPEYQYFIKVRVPFVALDFINAYFALYTKQSSSIHQKHGHHESAAVNL